MRPETDYALFKGHIASLGDDGTDVLFTLWPDGTAELAWRPGCDLTRVRWSPPVAMSSQGLGMPEAGR
jgi:hypothetical protein